MAEGSELVWRARRVAWLARSPLAKLIAAGAVPGGVWLRWAHPDLVTDLGRVGLGVAVGLAAWAGWASGDWLVLRRHRRERIEPLGWAVRHELGYSEDLPAGRFIWWDHNFGDEGTEIRVVLPRHWIGTDEQRRRLLRAVAEKGRFAEEDINHKWVLDGRWSFLRVTPRPPGRGATAGTGVGARGAKPVGRHDLGSGAVGVVWGPGAVPGGPGR
jgi:hypothetical protein